MSEQQLANPAATEQFGADLSQQLQAPCVVLLQGELGAGKTTLVRGFLHGLGYEGLVKSPTYTLVEQYELDDVLINHFDLYRLTDPLELDAMGFHDYFTDNAITFIEWPERAGDMLPSANCMIELKVVSSGRLVVMI